MSLFPAYSNNFNKPASNSIIETQESSENLGWLRNCSYKPIASYLNSSIKNEIWSDSSDEDSSSTCNDDKDTNKKIYKNNPFNNDYNELKKIAKHPRKSKKKSKTLRKEISLVKYETHVKDIYFEDKNGNKRFLTIDTLEFSVRPNYTLGFNLKKQNKHRHFKRYYTRNLNLPKKSTNEGSIIKYENSTDIVGEGFMDELKDEQKVLIQKFNKRITECPKDINAWLEYVQFQDQVIESCSFYKQKNIKEIITQKKLTIIEKALAINYDSVELLNLKLQLLSMSIPADQFLNKIEEMIKHDKKNIILWEALIKLTQTSCVLCKVSKVLESYVKYFSVLKQKCKTSPKFYDEQIFNLLYQCLIFLRHVGLWEQMWEILKINLHLNLEIDREILKNINTIDEKLIMDMEELILNSKLPLNQLWLRIELLRERCFWTSVDINQVNVNLIGDEKRLVSADEITNFIYPTITIESNFRLVIFTLICLKVPLLPSRHCTLKDFKLEKDCWTIDSLECILPMIYSTVWIGAVDKYLSNKFMLTSLFEGELTSGPQFIKYHPAQELYLDFIRLIFSTISQKLPITQRTSILIWWLRFERLLIFISKNEPLKEESKNKKAKSIIKNFLKKPENRNNLHFYREFALFEYELGSFDNCIYMLRKIIQSQDIKFLDNEEKAALLSLYRTSFEILLDLSTYKNSNLEIFNEMTESLKNYICVCFNYNQNMTVEEILYEEIIKFLTNSVADESEDSFLLPNLHCDLLICYSYILYSKNRNDTNSIFELFNRCLTHCNKCFRLQERFYETKMAFLQFLQHTVQKLENVLINTLNEALEKYPSNLFLLSLNASIESKLPYWKLKTSNKRYNIWSILANCLAGRARIIYLNNIGLEQSSNAMINKMLSFHKTLSITEEVQNCPLVWRFYMLLLREHDLSKNKGEEIYFQAVTQCPWSRSVYISAAEIAPQILSQIQDLIQEKELRIHVTPDELDILRG